jgi:hypothetical protein
VQENNFGVCREKSGIDRFRVSMRNLGIREALIKAEGMAISAMRIKAYWLNGLKIRVQAVTCVTLECYRAI